MLKKIILNITIVVLVVFILDFAIGKILNHFYFNESSGLHYRTTYALEKTTADVLIFGASRANHHYVPEVFENSLNLSYYNTGRDGNGIFYQLAVLKSVLKRYTPKILVLDFVGSFEKNEKPYDRLSSLLPYYKNHKEIQEIIELRSPYEKIKLLSRIYPYNSQLTSIAVGNLEVNKKRKNDNKGYVSLNGKWASKIDSIDKITTNNLDTIQLNALQEFVHLAKKSEANVYVIFSPIFFKFKKNENFDICNRICAIENVPFWDYSKDTTFLNNKQLFQDPDHLNHNGATIFSNKVVTRIKNKMNKSAISEEN